MTLFILWILRRAVRWEAPKELRALKRASYNKIAQAVATRYQFGNIFVSLLDLALKLDLPPRVQAALEANRLEEIGESDAYPGPSHEEGRRRVIKALGYHYQVWQLNTHPTIARVIEVCKNALAEYNPWIGVGAIAASEALVTTEFTQMFKAVMAHKALLEVDDFEHLISHIEHDDGHTQAILLAVAQSLRDPGDVIAVLIGIRRYKRAMTRFWREISEAELS